MAEKTIKVLKIDNTIKHYNVPTLNIINRKFDLTVMYYIRSDDSAIEDCEFKTIYVPIKEVSRFTIIKKNLRKFCKDFDVVIALDTMHTLNLYTLGWFHRKFKLLYWGIGAPASYTRHYGEASDFYFKMSYFMERKAEALIFYDKAAINLHNKRGFKGPKMFVAPNTTTVLKRDIKPEMKDSIMFIGSLYMEKGLQILLDAYKIAYEENASVVPLNLVGGGKPLPLVQQWVRENHLENIIHVLGPIYDNEKKAELFQQTIACISPLQGGLSVLESMGYGVPFITDSNAITGGEAFNIEDGRNGLRVKGMNTAKLKDIILDISSDKQKYVNMGKNAYEHYWNCRKPEDMAQGVIDAVEYTLNNK